MRNAVWNVAMVIALGLAGCGGEPAPAVGSVAQAAQCTCSVWRCESGICGYDTALYGACCTQCADSTHPEQPRLSCGGSSSICRQHPNLSSCMSPGGRTLCLDPCADLGCLTICELKCGTVSCPEYQGTDPNDPCCQPFFLP